MSCKSRLIIMEGSSFVPFINTPSRLWRDLYGPFTAAQFSILNTKLSSFLLLLFEWMKWILLSGAVIVTSVKAVWSHCGRFPSSFHAPQNKHTHTHTVSLSLHAHIPNARCTNCLYIYKLKLCKHWTVIQKHDCWPWDLWIVLRCVMRWRPWWGNMEWTPSRCSWPTKTWWCCGIQSSTRLCRPVRTSVPLPESTLKTESWWPRCKDKFSFPLTSKWNHKPVLKWMCLCC